MGDLLLVSMGRLLEGIPKSAHSDGILPSGVDRYTHVCVVAQRPCAAEKEKEADVTREADGKEGPLKITDFN